MAEATHDQQGRSRRAVWDRGARSTERTTDDNVKSPGLSTRALIELVAGARYQSMSGLASVFEARRALSIDGAAPLRVEQPPLVAWHEPTMGSFAACRYFARSSNTTTVAFP